MSLNPKVIIVGLVAAVLLGFGALSVSQQASAHVPQDETCSPNSLAGGGFDSNTTQDVSCVGVADLTNPSLHDGDLSCMDAVPNTQATIGLGFIVSGSVLAHTINDIIPICFDHGGGLTTPGGPIGFDSNDIGRWLELVCGQQGGTATDFEFSPSSTVTNTAYSSVDECPGIVGKGTDFAHANNYNGGILAFFQCPAVNSIANITIDHDGVIFSFTITCIGPAAQATIGVSPSTVEIIPMPGSQSYSRVTVTVADALGNRLDGVEVDFITDNCWFRSEVATQDRGTTSPRGGLDLDVRTHVSFTDTDTSTLSDEDGEGSTQDTAFINQSVGQVTGSFSTPIPGSGVPVAAGTAEVDLQCFPGTDTALAALAKPGPANITAIIRRTGTVGVCPVFTSVLTQCNALNGFPLNLTRTGSLPFGFEDIILKATVTVIGPPASITVAASPTALRCGEKSTITATIKDSLGANVSDHTRVELITNLGGVLAGTGAVTSGLGAGVVPISSTVAETFAGVATAFLITSEVTTGPYEVVVTAGGSFPVFSGLQIPSQTSFTQNSTANAIPGQLIFPTITNAGSGFGPTFIGGGGDTSPLSGVQEPSTEGVFSTAPVSAQTTVTCTEPAPAAPAIAAPVITAPRTGTGITPPNTGDAGLMDSSSSSWTLFAIAGLVAFAIAGTVTLRFGRR